MKKNLAIIGGGPRGLAMALRAAQHINDYNIYIIDPKPISTWQFPYMLTDMEMRSPITFDLTTFSKDLKEYSLPVMLNKRIDAWDQAAVENAQTYCSRKDFVNYLKYIIQHLKKVGVKFVPYRAKSITEDCVFTNRVCIHYDYLVVATGRINQVCKCPRILANRELVTMASLREQSWHNQAINVIGSGQQAAELVEYLARQKAKVYWLRKYPIKVKQFPVPGCRDWGIKSALGPYYSHPFTNKKEYLRQVKEWGPTMTPYIANKLESVKYEILMNVASTKDLDKDAHNILATGYDDKIKLINFSFDIATDKNNPDLPDVGKRFVSTSHPNIYFTGLLVKHYDGPRQGSIISSAPTAFHIMLDITS